MNEPTTIARKGWQQSWLEIMLLYVMTTIGTAHLLQLHWFIAMFVAPFVMLMMLAGVMLLVQLLWMSVLGLERVGTACGLRKSPLS